MFVLRNGVWEDTRKLRQRKKHGKNIVYELQLFLTKQGFLQQNKDVWQNRDITVHIIYNDPSNN